MTASQHSSKMSAGPGKARGRWHGIELGLVFTRFWGSVHVASEDTNTADEQVLDVLMCRGTHDTMGWC
ncbi:hypothetical protein M6B38_118780 [Iris pallida]|uniref:Uncharacterized protein n=1 Tax=Iris pallida TaxID=29817 RepID=A0AAX6HJN7_IRIPA|nr:hypothetical protein M6B38_118780 [Iris pallida]